MCLPKNNNNYTIFVLLDKSTHYVDFICGEYAPFYLNNVNFLMELMILSTISANLTKRFITNLQVNAVSSINWMVMM